MNTRYTMADHVLDAMAHADQRRYGGEAVSELEHALQCAELAEAAGADEALVLACLLHDVGRYAVSQDAVSDTTKQARPGLGRGHHDVGADLVAPFVPARTTWCIRSHADAKRYLCAVEPDYFATLSPVSRRTLEWQGGVMAADEAARFAAQPWAPEAIALRRWDDAAKDPAGRTRPLEHWAVLVRRYLGHP